MRNKNFKGVWPSVLIITSIIALAIPLLSPSWVHAALPSHAPISINGNDNFILANGVISGSGTENDPYIIENWIIDASIADGIHIENTDAHFVIRNCYIYNGKNSFEGICLMHTMNGRIDSVTSENNYRGILISISSDVTITNCTAANNWGTGVDVGYSPGAVIENCNVRNNTRGVVVSDASNKVRYCTVQNNNYGIILIDTDTNIVVGCTIENNYYSVDVDFSLFDDIENCTIKNNRSGIRTGLSLNNTIKNCIIENNPTGAYFSSSLRNFIENCTIENCGTGISFDNESFINNVTGCTFRNNTINISPKSSSSEWSLIAGIAGTIAIISIAAAVYIRRR